MDSLDLSGDAYLSPPTRPTALARLSPTLAFYRRFIPIVFRSSREAKRGEYHDARWAESSVHTIRALEAAGVRIEVQGISHYREVDGPCVFVGNHMSMCETVVLPGFVQPLKPITFVVKESLVRYPVFCHVMRSRDPIVVTRTNPRSDLKAMLGGGMRRLEAGRSIVVFPQTTRTTVFDPSQFNSIGVKLAARAGVPVVPVAVRTDAWALARWFIKDLGRIDPSKTVHIAFGEPLWVQARGDEEQQAVIAFIRSRLEAWGLETVR